MQEINNIIPSLSYYQQDPNFEKIRTLMKYCSKEVIEALARNYLPKNLAPAFVTLSKNHINDFIDGKNIKTNNKEAKKQLQSCNDDHLKNYFSMFANLFAAQAADIVVTYSLYFVTGGNNQVIPDTVTNLARESIEQLIVNVLDMSWTNGDKLFSQETYSRLINELLIPAVVSAVQQLASVISLENRLSTSSIGSLTFGYKPESTACSFEELTSENSFEQEASDNSDNSYKKTSPVCVR